MSPLQRLYRTKFTLLAVVSTFVGVGLIFLAHWGDSSSDGAWLKGWPLNDLGLGLFSTGLFGVLFQYVGQRDAEEGNLQRIRQVIAEDFAAKPDGLVALVSEETRDEIIENCLSLQLGDRAVADEVYADLRSQLAPAQERRYGMDVSVALAPWEGGPAAGDGSMFVATIRWEYRFVPVSPVMRFACVSDLDEYRELLHDPSATIVWYFQPKAGLDAASEETFQLVEFSVDGKPRPVRRTSRAGTQIYAATIGTEPVRVHREVTVAYTYRVLVQRHGHLLHLDISRPTKGLKVQFAYGSCGIRYVSVLDYVASSQQPRVSRLPTPSIEVAFDGWVLPKAGVAFVWVLDRELPRTSSTVARAT